MDSATNYDEYRGHTDPTDGSHYPGVPGDPGIPPLQTGPTRSSLEPLVDEPKVENTGTQPIERIEDKEISQDEVEKLEIVRSSPFEVQTVIKKEDIM